jgi:hypothetical protein
MKRVITALAALALSASPLLSQMDPRTGGLHLGLAINGTSVEIDDDDVGVDERESGGGLSLLVGYNFTRNIGVFLAGTAAEIDVEGGNFTLGHGDLGVRFSFPGKSAFVPYVDVAFTALNASDLAGDGAQFEDVELTGKGITAGAGFNYFFSRRVAFDMNLRFTGGEFDTVKFDGGSISSDDGISTNTGRLNIGIAWYTGVGGRR